MWLCFSCSGFLWKLVVQSHMLRILVIANLFMWALKMEVWVFSPLQHSHWDVELIQLLIFLQIQGAFLVCIINRGKRCASFAFLSIYLFICLFLFLFFSLGLFNVLSYMILTAWECILLSLPHIHQNPISLH